MADRSKIAWCDATWQVMAGCTKVSPGCKNCYSEKLLSTRLKHLPWAGDVTSGGKWNGQVVLRAEKLDEPGRWRRARRIFVADRGDLFHPEVPFEYIAAVFGVMAAAKQHTFLVLTKRPERMLEWFHWVASLGMLTCTRRNGEDPRDPRWAHYACVELAHKYMAGNQRKPEYDHRTPWPLSNVWLGVTCEDQDRANERIPILLKCPAAVRWVSAEPLLGPINFDPPRCDFCLNESDSVTPDGMPWCSECETECSHGHWLDFIAGDRDANEGITWVVAGGESGPNARDCEEAWIRSIRDQCDDAGTACFVKQMGSRSVRRYSGGVGEVIRYRDRPGADPLEWPEDMRVRELPFEPS